MVHYKFNTIHYDIHNVNQLTSLVVPVGLSVGCGGLGAGVVGVVAPLLLGLLLLLLLLLAVLVHETLGGVRLEHVYQYCRPAGGYSVCRYNSGIVPYEYIIPNI